MEKVKRAKTGILAGLIETVQSFFVREEIVSNGKVLPEDLNKNEILELARVLKASKSNGKKGNGSTMDIYKEEVDTAKALEAVEGKIENIIKEEKSIESK